MSFDLAKLIQVLAENAPSEAVGIFITTYGAFIVAFVMILIVLVRFIKKTSVNGTATDAEIQALKDSIKVITEQSSKIAVDNANVSTEIKEEIKANNDTTMQLFIALGLASGMNYTDITNIINKSKTIYNASLEQYNALQKEVESKQTKEAEAQAQAQAEAQAVNQDLASIKIGV